MPITIDEMLDLLSFAGTELVNGNANHGPMGAEALFTLGRDEAVLPWVEGYRDRLIDRPAPTLPIRRDKWRECLGKGERLGDWIQFFQDELAEKSWQSVLAEWVPQLAPALVSAATHGLIRTGHAARTSPPGKRGNASTSWLRVWGILGGALLRFVGCTFRGQIRIYARRRPGAGGQAART